MRIALLTAAGALLLPLAAHAQVTPPPPTGAPTDDSIGATAPTSSDAPDPSGATAPADPAASSTAPADDSTANATTSTDKTRHHKKMRKQKTQASPSY